MDDLQLGIVAGGLLRFVAGGALTILAGVTLLPRSLLGLGQRPVSCIAVGLLAAGILALVRVGRPMGALALAVAGAVLQVGLSLDHGWPRAALEPGWLLLAGGGAFLAAIVFDDLATSGFRFGKFVVMGTLFAGIYLSLTPVAMLAAPLERTVGAELMLNVFFGILVGDAVGLGVELLELIPAVRRLGVRDAS